MLNTDVVASNHRGELPPEGYQERHSEPYARIERVWTYPYPGGQRFRGCQYGENLVRPIAMVLLNAPDQPVLLNHENLDRSSFIARGLITPLEGSEHLRQLSQTDQKPTQWVLDRYRFHWWSSLFPLADHHYCRISHTDCYPFKPKVSLNVHRLGRWVVSHKWSVDLPILGMFACGANSVAIWHRTKRGNQTAVKLWSLAHKARRLRDSVAGEKGRRVLAAFRDGSLMTASENLIEMWNVEGDVRVGSFNQERHPLVFPESMPQLREVLPVCHQTDDGVRIRWIRGNGELAEEPEPMDVPLVDGFNLGQISRTMVSLWRDADPDLLDEGPKSGAGEQIAREIEVWEIALRRPIARILSGGRFHCLRDDGSLIDFHGPWEVYRLWRFQPEAVNLCGGRAPTGLHSFLERERIEPVGWASLVGGPFAFYNDRSDLGLILEEAARMPVPTLLGRLDEWARADEGRITPRLIELMFNVNDEALCLKLVLDLAIAYQGDERALVAEVVTASLNSAAGRLIVDDYRKGEFDLICDEALAAGLIIGEGREPGRLCGALKSKAQRQTFITGKEFLSIRQSVERLSRDVDRLRQGQRQLAASLNALKEALEKQHKREIVLSLLNLLLIFGGSKAVKIAGAARDLHDLKHAAELIEEIGEGMKEGVELLFNIPEHHDMERAEALLLIEEARAAVREGEKR